MMSEPDSSIGHVQGYQELVRLTAVWAPRWCVNRASEYIYIAFTAFPMPKMHAYIIMTGVLGRVRDQIRQGYDRSRCPKSHTNGHLPFLMTASNIAAL